MRGYKRVVRCFPHEAHDLVPCLEVLERANAAEALAAATGPTIADPESAEISGSGSASSKDELQKKALLASANASIPWSTKYILYLWLSMMLLSPFDLNTIISQRNFAKQSSEDAIDRILELAQVGLCDTGRLRDA